VISESPSDSEKPGRPRTEVPQELQPEKTVPTVAEKSTIEERGSRDGSSGEPPLAEKRPAGQWEPPPSLPPPALPPLGNDAAPPPAPPPPRTPARFGTATGPDRRATQGRRYLAPVAAKRHDPGRKARQVLGRQWDHPGVGSQQ